MVDSAIRNGIELWIVRSVYFVYGTVVDEEEFAEDVAKSRKFNQFCFERETVLILQVLAWSVNPSGIRSPLVFFE